MTNSRKRHTPEQVVRKLGQADRMLTDGQDVAAVCRELGVSEQTYYRWRNQYGGLKADDAKRLKELESRTRRSSVCSRKRSWRRPRSRSWLRETSKPGQAPRRRRSPHAQAAGERTDGVPSGRAEPLRVSATAQGRHGRGPGSGVQGVAARLGEGPSPLLGHVDVLRAHLQRRDRITLRRGERDLPPLDHAPDRTTQGIAKGFDLAHGRGRAVSVGHERFSCRGQCLYRCASHHVSSRYPVPHTSTVSGRARILSLMRGMGPRGLPGVQILADEARRSSTDQEDTAEMTLRGLRRNDCCEQPLAEWGWCKNEGFCTTEASRWLNPPFMGSSPLRWGVRGSAG